MLTFPAKRRNTKVFISFWIEILFIVQFFLSNAIDLHSRPNEEHGGILLLKKVSMYGIELHYICVA